MQTNNLSSNRKVIFVGGTSYSGSTLMDMMLAHGDGGFSCGEVSAVFQPYRKKHILYHGHASPAIQIPWERLIAAGPDRLFATIFNEDQTIRRIIDSSKDPQWISARSAALEAQGIAVRHVLIWKTPGEFFRSRKKRGRERNWERAWVNYHRHYFRQVTDFASLSYKELVTEPRVLTQLCEYLDIPYFPLKHEYWRGNYQTLFGNRSAKVHLFDLQSSVGEEPLVSKDTEKVSVEKHRRIYYDTADTDVYETDLSPRCKPYLQFLRDAENRLMSRRVGAPEPPSELKASQMSIAARSIKRSTMSSIVRAIIST